LPLCNLFSLRILIKRFYVLQIGYTLYMPDEIVKVVAYSGYRGEECPRLFMIRGQSIEVKAIVSMWVEEQIENKKRKRIFQVRGSDGYEHKIYYDEEMKQWYLAKE